jgi:hypothetical protein
MEQPTRFIGMDVHKDTIVVAVTAAGDVGKATPYGTFPNTAAAQEKLVNRVAARCRSFTQAAKEPSAYLAHLASSGANSDVVECHVLAVPEFEQLATGVGDRNDMLPVHSQ